jgi:hypothetical protein
MNYHVISLYLRERGAQYLGCTYLDIGDDANNGQLNINALRLPRFRFLAFVTCILNRKSKWCLSLKLWAFGPHPKFQQPTADNASIE